VSQAPLPQLPCHNCGGLPATGNTLVHAAPLAAQPLVPLAVHTTTTTTYAPTTTYQVHPPQPLQQLSTTLPVRRSRSGQQQQASAAEISLYQHAHQAWQQRADQVNNSSKGGGGKMVTGSTQTGDFEKSLNQSGLNQESYILVENGQEAQSPSEVDTEVGPSASFVRAMAPDSSQPASDVASEPTELAPRRYESAADLAAASEAARGSLAAAAEAGLSEALLGALPAAIDARVSAERIEAARFRCAEEEARHWETRSADSAYRLLREAIEEGNLESLTAATRRAQEAGVDADAVAKAKAEMEKLQHQRHAEEALYTHLKTPSAAPTDRRTAGLAEAIANAVECGVSAELVSHARARLQELEHAEDKQRGAAQAERAVLACAERPDASPASLAEALDAALEAGADLRATSRAAEKKLQLSRQEFVARRSELAGEQLSRAVREANARDLCGAMHYSSCLGAPEEILQRAERRRLELEEANLLASSGGLSAVEVETAHDAYSPFSADLRASTMTLPPDGRRQTFPIESRKSLPVDDSVRKAPQSNWEPNDDLPMYGLDRDLQEEASRKYDTDAEKKAAVWVEDITGYHIQGNFGPSLRTGQVLCELVNLIKPGTIGKINEAGAPWKERENLNHFLAACRQLGVHEYALFSTNDLYDGKNLTAVVRCVHALGGAVQKSVPDFKGPSLGVADTSKAKVDRRRELGVASQTAGFHGAMERSPLDVVSGQIVRAYHHGGS